MACNVTPFRDMESEVNLSAYPYPGNKTLDTTWDTGQYLKILGVCGTVLISIFGNVLVILAVVRHRAMRTTINFYLVNLSIADLLISAWCPWTSLIQQVLSPSSLYILPPIFCKLDVFYRVLCTVASVLTLSAISFDRFLAVIFPLQTRVTQRKARYLIVMVWISALTVASPFLLYRRVTVFRWEDFTEVSCHEVFPTTVYCDPITNKQIITNTAKKIFYSIVTIVMYLVPVLVMSVSYTMILIKLFCRTQPGERVEGRQNLTYQSQQKRKVVKMVVMVLLVFVVCCSPIQLLMASAIFRTDAQLPSWLGSYKFWIEFMSYSHTMLNPIIYVIFSNNFRQSFINMLSCNNKEINRDMDRNSSVQRRVSWRRGSLKNQPRPLNQPRPIALRNLQPPRVVELEINSRREGEGFQEETNTTPF
ncbi:substance-P receptor isoform X2 [Eurytemora carolleeae]|uniref:substance-P receptor isoform X2 n=1 Tax=Eurytemora carolleeae TaxID=1294199 RepID=UPI000C7614FC|nr:substance-P receptor isoform X2 [Eurytemora carolleeae]|eukprot:XP_023338028.1 substance-P receptor-like isoform X2 [Eurytemora affinis]